MQPPPPTGRDHHPPPPPMALLQMVTAKWLSQAVYVAAKLGIADLVKDGPRSSEELARETGANPAALYRVLRALAGAGIFAETPGQRFEMTPTAAYLQSNVPGSLRATAVMMGEPWHWAAWGDFLHSVRTGEPAFDHVHGMGVFDYLRQDAEAARIFNDSMSGYSAQESVAVAGAYDFSGVRTLMDVGGGHGVLLGSLLKANPHLQGILFDLPEVTAGAPPRLSEAGVESRCKVASGSFFEHLPHGADACILKHIIHDWSDDHCLTILRNCRAALPPGGRLLLVEMVIPPGNAPSPGKLLDLEMLAMTTGGRERTAEEFTHLLRDAGFTPMRVIPTDAATSIIEGTVS